MLFQKGSFISSTEYFLKLDLFTFFPTMPFFFPTGHLACKFIVICNFTAGCYQIPNYHISSKSHTQQTHVILHNDNKCEKLDCLLLQDHLQSSSQTFLLFIPGSLETYLYHFICPHCGNLLLLHLFLQLIQ